MLQPRITLDQWDALVAVVEAGGYAPASSRLHRTQSTVTYTIKKLEDLLGVKVFELQGRKAVLTPIGEVLYRRGQRAGRRGSPARARGRRTGARLGAGDPPRRRHHLPDLAAARVPGRVRRRNIRDTRIELIESVLGGTEEALTEGRADFVDRQRSCPAASSATR